MSLNSFMTEGRYHIETSPLICSANHWNGFYMITVSVMKKLIHLGIVSKIRSVIVSKLKQI